MRIPKRQRRANPRVDCRCVVRAPNGASLALSTGTTKSNYSIHTITLSRASTLLLSCIDIPMYKGPHMGSSSIRRILGGLCVLIAAITPELCVANAQDQAPKTRTSSLYTSVNADETVTVNGRVWEQSQMRPALASDKISAPHSQNQATQTPAPPKQADPKSSPRQTH
jgi:hypothetical protein